MQLIVLGTSQLEIEKNNEQLCGIVLTKAKAQVLINNQSVTPHCYKVKNNDFVLRAATENGKNPLTEQIAHARVLHSFSGVDWVFITFKYVLESLLT